MDMLQLFANRSRDDHDFFHHRAMLGDEPIVVAGYRSMIDLPNTMSLLQLQARSARQDGASDLLVALGATADEPDQELLASSLLQGKLIVYFERRSAYSVFLPQPKPLSRSIQPPTTENVLRGSLSAFTEDLDTNVGMLKLHVHSDLLRVRSFPSGGRQSSRLLLIYKEDDVDPALLDALVRRLAEKSGPDVFHLQRLSERLGFGKWNFITKFNTTELPQDAASALRKGKVILFMERFPFAIVLPSGLWDMFDVESDRNFPYPFMNLFRLLRIFGVLSNMLLPGLYVALVSVNPELLRIELALTIAKSRMSVPYPAVIETILLLVILELVLEASIRLPKSIGPTVTMVGGIILGQAVVAAKLVSNLLIIILAATTIANATTAGYHNTVSIRIFKYLLVALSAMYGVLGLMSGLLIVCAYAASITSFGIPYVRMPKNGGGSNG